MYLAGSMHALTAKDYPLPQAYASAFKRSERLVEELDLNAVTPDDVRKAIAAFGKLPPDDTLAKVMGKNWTKAQKLAKASGINLEMYQRFKPWFAAIRIAGRGFIRAGYRANLGLDQHFASLAAARKLPVIGLETLDSQMGFLNAIPLPIQRRFLLQTLKEIPSEKRELAAMHEAWRNGNVAALAAIARKDFAGYPKLRRRLLGKRNRRWLPRLKHCLASNEGCFVVVGVEHMTGPTGLLALLKNAGYQIRQLRGTPAPPRASAAATSAT